MPHLDRSSFISPARFHRLRIQHAAARRRKIAVDAPDTGGMGSLHRKTGTFHRALDETLGWAGFLSVRIGSFEGFSVLFGDNIANWNISITKQGKSSINGPSLKCKRPSYR